MALSRLSKYVTNPIEEEDAIVNKLIKSRKKVIRLSRGDPALYFKTPKYMIDAYVRALKDHKTFYSEPAGVPELREAVARRYKSLYGLEVSSEEVMVTQGISEALPFINGAMINQGDKAVLFDPSYPPYLPYLRLYGGNEISGKYEEANSWNVDTEHLRRLLKKEKGKIKYMLITNPNNPTGTVLKKAILEEIVEIANEHGIMLISDEIYDELVFKGAKFTSLCEVAKGTNYMILNGASKDFDATGFRIGFVVLPGGDKEVKALREKLLNFAMVRLSPNTPAQYAVAEGLNNVKEHRRSLKVLVHEVEKRANFVTKLVNESEYMQAVVPKGAFYVFPRLNLNLLKIKTDREFVDKLLIEEDVQLTRGSGFRSPGHVRIVALAPKSVLEEAINRTNKFSKRHAK